MFARIARFEGGSPDVIDREVDRLRRDIEAARAGNADTVTARLSSVVDRVVMLVDRENAAATTIVFCETEDKLREADRILDSMSPATGEGRRVSRDLFEVAIDDSPGAARKAA
jgi:hypothetical protein